MDISAMMVNAGRWLQNLKKTYRLTNRAISLAGLIAVCLLTILFLSLHSRGYATRRAYHEDPFPWILESPFVSAYRGMRVLCQQFEKHAYASRPEDVEWRALIEKQNEDKSPATAESLINKIAVWQRPLGASKMRALCLIQVYSGAETIKALHSTWASKCDQHLFVVGKKVLPEGAAVEGVPKDYIVELEVPIGSMDQKNQFQRVRSTIGYLLSGAGRGKYHFDFALFCSDDSFVIPENLDKMLSEPQHIYLHKQGVPLVLGHRMVLPSGQPFVTGAHYVVNTVAMKIMHVMAHHDSCAVDAVDVAEDTTTANCLAALNIYPLDTADEYGEDRMLMWPLKYQADLANARNADWWYPKYRHRAQLTGDASVSRFTIAFHDVTVNEMSKYHTLIYGKNH